MGNIDDIIADYIAEEPLSPEEEKLLYTWAKEENNKQLILFAKKLEKSKAFRKRYQEDSQLPLQNIQQEILKIRKSYILRYAVAAAMILFIGVNLFLYIGRTADKENSDQLLTKNSKSHAELILADGRNIPLYPTTETVLIDSIAGVANRSNTVIYTEENSEDIVEYNTLTVPLGAEYNLVLSDGTKVYLNSGSELRFPVSFTGDVRDVYLSGEAYFEVTHNADKCFIVHTDDMRAIVLGTTFNIKSYTQQTNIATTLESGRLRVICDDQEFDIHPGCQVVYDKTGKKSYAQEVDSELYTSWKDGYYLFNDTPFEEIMSTLSLWYDVEVRYENSNLKGILFSGKFRRYDDIQYLLNMFAETNEVRYTIKDNIVTVRPK